MLLIWLPGKVEDAARVLGSLSYMLQTWIAFWLQLSPVPAVAVEFLLGVDQQMEDLAVCAAWLAVSFLPFPLLYPFSNSSSVFQINTLLKSERLNTTTEIIEV